MIDFYFILLFICFKKYIYIILLCLYITTLFIYYYLIYINLVWIFFKFKNHVFFSIIISYIFFIWFFSSVLSSLSLILFPSQFSPSIPYYFQNQIALWQNWRVNEHFGLNNFFFWVSSFFPSFFKAIYFPLVCCFSML